MTGRQTAPLCFLTDFTGGEERLSSFLAAGISWIQYRDKTSPRRVIHERAMQIRAITRRFGTLFIMNDHADIAVAVDADGVHLGQDDLPLEAARVIVGNRIVGISTHSVDEAIAAAAAGADYIGFGPIFPSTTKDAGMPKGPAALRGICTAVSVPVIAIGGITAENAASVFFGGAHGIAVSSALQEGAAETNVRRFLDAVRESGGIFLPW